ncbi:hypothetical protein BGAL_0267g00140 [Botrytis galanthina]|uniref:Uncharacterized protein n=1 Tax=Botrytis galanthina TaxID=278940 RepID=A0A4S8R4M2_9HELO|nr:hypothetical protein BGAL_0267g00140 [Botrytis galanthina]
MSPSTPPHTPPIPSPIVPPAPIVCETGTKTAPPSVINNETHDIATGIRLFDITVCATIIPLSNPTPTPRPARTWNPAFRAYDVVTDSVVSSPEPMANNTMHMSMIGV